MVVLTVAVLQTAVVPVLSIIAAQLDASAVAVSWAVTANLLAAAAATPLIGRLADLHSKKRVLLGVLVIVLLGSILAAATSSLALLILGRVLQGASFALYPIGVAILREELDPDRLVGAMSVISGTLGFGGGVGLVVTGLLMSGDAGYHRVFWLTTAFTILVIAIVVLVVPARQPGSGGSIDWLGAAGLAAGLSMILLAITQGKTWGWTSPWTLGCAAAGIVVFAGWWLWERRAEQPLVSTRMLTRRPILLTNLATVFVGMGLYFAFLGLTQFVQMPRAAAGYGFGASVLASQRHIPATGRSHRVSGGLDQRPIHRSLRRPTRAGRRRRVGHRRVRVHRARPFAGLAGDRRRHPGQCLHQPGLRRLAGPDCRRGRRRRDRCCHEHECHRPHGRKFDRRGVGRRSAHPIGRRRFRRSDGEQLHRDLPWRRRDRRSGDGA